ncbi:MAG TPA: hypothetical protein VFV95_18245 [Vicinamibacterales bacterium]|nr:hypothetical protein [Vicinamibacterales bacterium]
MLWLKGWLETRSRVVFALLWTSSYVLLMAAPGRAAKSSEQQGIVLSMLALGFVFIPVWLAGSGIRTQQPFGFGSTKGLHGSTLFTLSLPVSRARLLLVRAALGLLEMVGLIVVLTSIVWIFLPVVRTGTHPGEWLLYVMTVSVCASGIYGLTMIAATLVDDAWIIPFSTVAIILLWMLQFFGDVPPWANIYRPMAQGSPLVTHSVPWAPMAAALVVGAAGLLVSLRIVQRQEY